MTYIVIIEFNWLIFQLCEVEKLNLYPGTMIFCKMQNTAEFAEFTHFITDNCRIDLKFDQDPIKLQVLAESFGRIDNQLAQNTSVVVGKLQNNPNF